MNYGGTNGGKYLVGFHRYGNLNGAKVKTLNRLLATLSWKNETQYFSAIKGNILLRGASPPLNDSFGGYFLLTP